MRHGKWSWCCCKNLSSIWFQLELETFSFGLSGPMSFDMFCQMITSHESSFTNWTNEFLLTSMCAFVSWQFIWTRKLPRTSFPSTNERFFTWKKIKFSFFLKFNLAFQLNWEIKITISSSKLTCHYHWCTCMSSDMSFEMRAFVVGFCTIFILTLISPSSINVWFFIRRYWIDDIHIRLS